MTEQNVESVFLLKQDRHSRLRSRSFASFAEARAKADEVIARPTSFKAVWIVSAAGEECSTRIFRLPGANR